MKCAAHLQLASCLWILQRRGSYLRWRCRMCGRMTNGCDMSFRGGVLLNAAQCIMHVEFVRPLAPLLSALQGFARLSAVYGGTYMLSKPDCTVRVGSREADRQADSRDDVSVKAGV